MTTTVTELPCLNYGVHSSTVTVIQIDWADLIFVMEKMQWTKLSHKFRRYLNSKKIICLDIPDEYGYMQPEWVKLLEAKAGYFLK